MNTKSKQLKLSNSVALLDVNAMNKLLKLTSDLWVFISDSYIIWQTLRKLSKNPTEISNQD